MSFITKDLRKTLNKELRPTLYYYLIGAVLATLLCVVSTILAVWGFIKNNVGLYSSMLPLSIVLLYFMLRQNGYLIAYGIFKNYCYRFLSKYIVDNNNYSIVLSGLQGTGKSMLAKFLVKYKARALWLLTQYEYRYYSCLDYKGSSEARKIEDWEECSESYAFYLNNKESYPCAFSNVNMFIDNKAVYKLDYWHCMQKMRLPYNHIELVEEASMWFPPALSHDTPNELVEDNRFGRQMLNRFRIYCEQRQSGLMLAIRSVSFNYVMGGCGKVLAPKLIIWLKDRVITRFMKGKKSDKLLALKIKGYNELINKIGFWRFKRRLLNGTEENTMFDEVDEQLYFPVNQNIDCPTRLYRSIYRARKKPIEAELYKDSILTRSYNGLIED